MKVISKIIIVSILIIGNYCKGQSIPLLPLTDAEWEYEVWDPGGSTWMHQYIIGNTIIDSLIYTEFKIDYYRTSWDWPYFIDTIVSSSRIFHIRVDSGRIYRRNELQKEILLFNSNWNVGDTIIHQDTYIDSVYVLVQIDTVEYGNIKRRRWIFDNPSMMIGTVSFIEGIGGMNFDISEPVFDMFWEGGGTIKCFAENQIHIIANGCRKTLDISKYNTPIDIKVYPIPADSELNINLNPQDISDLEIEIYDINGKLVLSQNIYEKNTRIMLPESLVGLYLLNITNGETLWEKLILIE